MYIGEPNTEVESKTKDFGVVRRYGYNEILKAVIESGKPLAGDATRQTR